MTAYAFFVQTCREEHKRKHPEEQVDMGCNRIEFYFLFQVVFTEFSRKCADRWKTMSDFEKKRFNMMAESDKKRFDTEVGISGVQNFTFSLFFLRWPVIMQTPANLVLMERKFEGRKQSKTLMHLKEI